MTLFGDDGIVGDRGGEVGGEEGAGESEGEEDDDERARAVAKVGT